MPTDIQKQLDDIWDRAKAYYSANLTDNERKRLFAIDSQEALLQHVQSLEIKYSKTIVPRLLRKTRPFMAQMRSFTQIINIFVQSSDISSFVWGPLALIFELGGRHEDTLEVISGVLEQIEAALPRFQDYLKEFSPCQITNRFKDALVIFYAELIGHYQDSIQFLRSHPLKNVFLLNRPANRFNLEANKRVQRLRERTNLVEQEVNLLVFRTHKAQGQQILQVLEAFVPQAQAMALPLPYRDFPFSRNTQFHFRDPLLGTIRSHLENEEKSTTLRTVSLFGLGGIGKTQIALEYAYRERDRYDAIFWVRAETEAKIRQSIRTYGQKMQGNIQSGPQGDVGFTNTFLKWLTTAKTQNPSSHAARWLLIFDNVEEIKVLRSFWPEGTQGSIISTTRDLAVAREFGQKAIEVPLFTPEQSERFIVSLNPVSGQPRASESAAIKTITDRLGYLPLVLHSIGLYTSSIGATFQNFLQHYSDFDENFIFQDTSANMTPYEKTLRTTWTMGLSKIESGARDMMQEIVFFDPDGIPVSLLRVREIDEKMRNGPSEEFPMLQKCVEMRFSDRQCIDSAIAALRHLSLVGKFPDHDKLFCHRLVREAVLKSIDKDDFQVLFDRAVFNLNALFPMAISVQLLEAWDTCGVYHSHLSSLMNIYNRFNSSLRPPILLCEIIRRCAWYLMEYGSFQEALEMTKAGCTILETATTKGKHPGFSTEDMCRSTADLYAIVGKIEYELNLPRHGGLWFEKAEIHRRKLIDTDKVQGFDLQVMAIEDCSIALASLAGGGSPQPVITACSFLLDEFSDKPGRHSWAADLSIAYRLEGKLQTSLAWCKKSENWTNEMYGDSCLRMAIVSFNMGNTYLLMKHGDMAFKAFDKCLRIRQQKAPNHRYTGYACHKMGIMMRARGDLDSAIASFRSAVNILDVCEGQKGAITRSKFMLSEVLKEQGAFNESDEMRRRVKSDLASLGVPEKDVIWKEEFFDKYVLFNHR